MDDCLEMIIVLFAYLPVLVIPMATLIYFLVCLIRKSRFTCPFSWVDPLFAVGVPVLWRHLLLVFNPHVGMGGLGLVFYVGGMWSLLIFVRFAVVRLFPEMRSRAVLLFSMLQIAVVFGMMLLAAFANVSE